MGERAGWGLGRRATSADLPLRGMKQLKAQCLRSSFGSPKQY